MEVEEVSKMKVVQPESRWSLMSVDLTGLLQMGQATAMAGGLNLVVELELMVLKAGECFQNEAACGYTVVVG